MTGQIVFDPLLPWPLIAVLGALAAAGVALALWRGLPGWALAVGAVLYDGEATVPFGDRLWAVPIRRLWEAS